MLALLDEIFARLDRSEPVALCILARARGSTPQVTGATMLVLASGETIGTLGGGCVEAEVRTRALRSLSASQPASTDLASFKLDHDYGWDDGLMCGGTMDVAIQILRTPSDAEPLRALRDSLAVKTSAAFTVNSVDVSGAPQSFEVPFSPRPTLLIAGAGHVGQAIATIAAMSDFDVVVFDDREEFLTERRFPKAQRICGDVARSLTVHAIDPHTFVVIVTRGHRNDASALAAIIQSSAAYVGMIGSKRKVRTILEGLEKSGVPRECLLKVHAPIGLEIGAITPGEIAVSVCAELIAVRRGHGETSIESLRIKQHELERWLDRDQP